METQNETIVDKAVNLVKDAFGIPHDTSPEVVADPKLHDTEEEEVAENAMSLDPNGYVVNSAGVVAPASQAPGAPPLPMSDAERLRREVDEYPIEKTPLESGVEAVRRENGF